MVTVTVVETAISVWRFSAAFCLLSARGGPLLARSTNDRPEQPFDSSYEIHQNRRAVSEKATPHGDGVSYALETSG